MTYDDFKAEYFRLLTLLVTYDPNQAESVVYSEELGKLVDTYPEFEELLDNEEL